MVSGGIPILVTFNIHRQPVANTGYTMLMRFERFTGKPGRVKTNGHCQNSTLTNRRLNRATARNVRTWIAFRHMQQAINTDDDPHMGDG
jgi:hypothetical protein